MAVDKTGKARTDLSTLVGRSYPKRLVLVSLACFLLSSVGLSHSQGSGSGSGSGVEPEQNITNLCPVNSSCSDLGPLCIVCDFNSSCAYGNETEVVCHPRESVECVGNHTLIRNFTCRFCYQLPEEQTCCEPNTSCNVRGTPLPLYVANCTTRDDVLCIPPRTFQQQRRCNYSNGKRWSTAFLLSVTVGGFGVDRFYLEHWGSAVGKLVSFGGLGVWSILDVILVVTGYLGPADGSAYIH